MVSPWNHRKHSNVNYYLVLTIWLINVSNSYCGCYSRRMCCTGRNVTCKAKDDGIDSIPLITALPPVRLVKFRGEEYPPVLSEDGQKIGRLILPDIVEIDNQDLKFAQQFKGHAEFLTAMDGEEYRRKFTFAPARQHGTKTKTITEIIFGSLFDEPETPEVISYEEGRPIIRLSTLNRYLPVRIGQIEDPGVPLHGKGSEEYPAYEGLMFLTESDPDCFCDEYCVQYGDCCSDYTYVCLPTDCQVNPWSEWTGCQPYNSECGHGKQERKRTVRIEAAHAGMPCPPLVEARACDKSCPVADKKDKTTVALLLPYKYHKSRDSFKHPRAVIPNRNHTNYCVKYKLGWVNRNCVEKEFKQSLVRGHEICAECQPQAQYHRNTPRCASDLEDGQKGYWKLIGPPSCYGIWYREKRYENCYCNSFPGLKHLDPYLMV